MPWFTVELTGTYTQVLRVEAPDGGAAIEACRAGEGDQVHDYWWDTPSGAAVMEEPELGLDWVDHEPTPDGCACGASCAEVDD